MKRGRFSVKSFKKFIFGSLFSIILAFPILAARQVYDILCDENGSGWCCQVNETGGIVGPCWNDAP